MVCALLCGTDLKADEVAAHMPQCPMRQVWCELCGAETVRAAGVAVSVRVGRC